MEEETKYTSNPLLHLVVVNLLLLTSTHERGLGTLVLHNQHMRLQENVLFQLT